MAFVESVRGGYWLSVIGDAGMIEEPEAPSCSVTTNNK